MCPTGLQLSKNIRFKKNRRNRVAALFGAPMRRAVIYAIAVMSPRKPNSARRTFAKAKVTFSVKRTKVFAKIPGIGNHFLQNHSIVLFRGGSPKDSPGINYTLIRGKLDFYKYELYGRKKRRSKFGVKKLN